MKLLLISVLFLAFIAIATCQESSRPSVNCDDMVAQTGRSYNEIYVPHESNCNKFYQCTDHGLVELKCHQTLVFFPYINGCVEKAPDNCITYNTWRSLNP
ncbi:CLUMA_CG014445, isoform A [Clunio marinus]|uniref:CLUMA_CG014445, isoform A n=1 Tax=Clunio marinus TaxID=568069 RepID=A0A1J1ILI8_9DIPT|nr:CLUMA_CG014445, isoform A [Clunio marinus]